jgi:membrane peptidoglycan carboxypeptidase
MFMDVGTDFGGNYTPTDADPLERGPVRVRNALQFSLNIPSVKAAAVNDVSHLFARAGEYGMSFLGDGRNIGLSIALGVTEVRPVDLVTAYGTLANGGKKVGHTTILSIRDQSGADKIPPYQPPAGDQVATPQAAFIVTDILAGNTNPDINPFWGKFELTDRSKKHRPATLKTGTNNDAKDLNAYGFIAPPTAKGRDAGEYALAVGAWNGNSDNTVVSTPAKPVFSIDVTTYVWQGFLQEASQHWAINDFAAPAGLVRAKIDPFTGTKPAAGVRGIDEWFIQGTEPQPEIPEGQCGQAVLQTVGFEAKYNNWMSADLDWIARAQRGPGTAGGVNKTRTAYFYNGAYHPYGNSWGALVAGHGCEGPSPITSCYPLPTPDASGVIPSFVPPSADPSASPPVILVPCPTPIPSASPSATPSETPSETPKHTPPPKDSPTPPPPPTPTPSAESSAAAAQPS